MFKKMFTEASRASTPVTGEKEFNTMQGVGKAKYVINTHDGKGTHKDGSKFFGIETFSNVKKFNARKKELIASGYKEY